jgi:hypothetical protein
MSVAATFLGGAGGRLLPLGIPLRFSLAAAVYHVLAWLALAACAGDALSFGGGLGWPLAALHLFTLGVFGMTALGAAAQLLPVATRQSPVGERALKAIWWLYVPGVAAVALGMGEAQPALLAAGALAVGLALLVWSALVARHLAGARGMPGVAAHAWVALASLWILLASALLLVAGWLGWPTPSRQVLLPMHLLFAPFGFMGMLALGLSYILVPMFALAHPPRDAVQLGSCALLVSALGVAAGSLLATDANWLRAVAWTCAVVGVLLHLQSMRRTLASGMRKELGRSFVLVKLAWAALVLALLCGGLAWAGADVPRLRAWIGLALLAWLLGFVMGILQRILPFLAALHAAAGRRRGPTASSLTHEGCLRVHFACHLAAFALLALGVATDSALVARLGALAGLAGALAFAGFCLQLVRRLRRAAP